MTGGHGIERGDPDMFERSVASPASAEATEFDKAKRETVNVRPG